MSRFNGPIRARSWESLFHMREVSLARTWLHAVVNLGITQALEEDEKLSWEEDDDEIANMLSEGEKPDWFPSNLARILIRIEFRPQAEAPDIREPHPIQPHGPDTGCRQFESLILHTCRSFGFNFAGTLDITLYRVGLRTPLGSMRHEVEVGQPDTGGMRSGNYRGQGDGPPQHHDPMVNWAMNEVKESNRAMREMFSQSSATLGSAAALVNATRGHNPAPPWADGGMMPDDGNPWMNLLMHGLSIAAGTQNMPGQPGPQQMPHQGMMPGMMPGQQPHMIPAGPRALALPGPIAADPGDDAWETGDEFGEMVDHHGGSSHHSHGQFDGVPVTDDQMLSDDQYWDEEYDGDDDYEGYPHQDYEHPQPQPYGQDARAQMQPAAPFDDMTDEEFAEIVAQRAERMDKGKVMQMGQNIMQRVLRN